MPESELQQECPKITPDFVSGELVEILVRPYGQVRSETRLTPKLVSIQVYREDVIPAGLLLAPYSETIRQHVYTDLGRLERDQGEGRWTIDDVLHMVQQFDPKGQAVRSG